MKTKTQFSPSTSASAKRRPTARTASSVVTPGGEELVLLSRAEYDSLINRAAELYEDAADVAIYDARKAHASPMLPAEVSMAVLRGDSRLRALRQWRDIGQVYLASKTEISQGFLSDLETGKRNMTAEVRRRIAKVLEVPEGWLN
jgi:hypothetical protein